MFIEKVFKVAGFPDFHAMVCGDETQPLLIALHGWLDNAASFSALAPLLKKHYVVALDLYGHGHSPHLKEAAAYTFVNQLPALSALFTSITDKSFSILGHSMGAGIATVYAGCFPDQVHALFLLDMVGPLSSPVSAFVARLQEATASVVNNVALEHTLYPNTEAMVERRAKLNQLTFDQVRPMVERAIMPAGNGFQWRCDTKLLLPSMMYMTEEQVHALLSKIASPVHVMLGQSGYAVNSDFLMRRMHYLRQSTLTWFPGGHHFHMECPQKVAEYIN